MGPKPEVRLDFYVDGELSLEHMRSVVLSCNEEPYLQYYDYLMNLTDEELLRKTDRGLQEEVDTLLALTSINEYVEGCYWNARRGLLYARCNDGECLYSGYIPDNMKIAFYLNESETVVISNTINRKGFFEKGTLHLSTIDQTVIVDSSASFKKSALSNFIVSFVLTLVLELLVAWLFLRKMQKTKLLKWFALANIISLPVFWALVPNRSYIIGILVGEILIFAFEALFVWLLSKKQLSLGNAFSISAAANAISFIIGGILVLILRFVFWF